MTQLALAPLLALRQHQRDGQRSPHKPLLVLLALGQLAATGSSRLVWSETSTRLAGLMADFGPPSRTSATQSAAYPFTRLRSDRIWTLDRDVPMDLIGPLNKQPVTGRFTPRSRSRPGRPGSTDLDGASHRRSGVPVNPGPRRAHRGRVDPDSVLGPPAALLLDAEAGRTRRRSSAWPAQVLAGWDRQCVFCGYDGLLGHAVVGLEAAHVRWFNFDGPDDLDNGLALCALDHKLFDRGVLGLTEKCTITVSDAFSARTTAGRRVYDLAGRVITRRLGTQLPAARHIAWHTSQVFKGNPLAV